MNQRQRFFFEKAESGEKKKNTKGPHCDGWEMKRMIYEN
jgi:hypothetical protein